MSILTFVALAAISPLAGHTGVTHQINRLGLQAPNWQAVSAAVAPGLHIASLSDSTIIAKLRTAGIVANTLATHVHLDARHPYDSSWNYLGSLGSNFYPAEDQFVIVQNSNFAVAHMAKKGVPYTIDFCTHTVEATGANIAYQTGSSPAHQETIKADTHITVVVVPKENGLEWTGFAVYNIATVVVAGVDISDVQK